MNEKHKVICAMKVEDLQLARKLWLKNILFDDIVYVWYFNRLSLLLENIFHIYGRVTVIGPAGSYITLFWFWGKGRHQLLTPFMFQKHSYALYIQPYDIWPYLILWHSSKEDIPCCILQRKNQESWRISNLPKNK